MITYVHVFNVSGKHMIHKVLNYSYTNTMTLNLPVDLSVLNTYIFFNHVVLVLAESIQKERECGGEISPYTI